MAVINPLFHMDPDYMWRWYTTDPHGRLVSMSARAFFDFKDARSDYDADRHRSGPSNLN